jgi:hypothetical protein
MSAKEKRVVAPALLYEQQVFTISDDAADDVVKLAVFHM